MAATALIIAFTQYAIVAYSNANQTWSQSCYFASDDTLAQAFFHRRMMISKRIHIYYRVSQPAVFLFRRNFVRLRPPRTGSAGCHWYREPDEPIQVSQRRSDQLPVTFLSWGQGSAFSQVSYFLYIKCVVLY